MTQELIVVPKQKLARIGLAALPSLIAMAGEHAQWKFIEFFTANIRNKHTRRTYSEAVQQFFA